MSVFKTLTGMKIGFMLTPLILKVIYIRNQPV